MVTTKLIKIVRLTGAGETPATATDFIDFNDATSGDFKNVTKEGAYSTSIEREQPEGIGNNMAAELADGNVQSQGVISDTFIIDGFITLTKGTSDDGLNAFLVKLADWKTNAQTLVDTWEGGRFGIVDSTDATNNITPIGTGLNTVGLIFTNYKKKRINKDETRITLTFRKSRGLDA